MSDELEPYDDDEVEDGNRSGGSPTATAVVEYLVRELVDDPEAVTVET
ncbi:MAG: hypothetical protein JWO68_2051, partial [Actinomycetia bacterium]|nr:hypothetical protein [Actinomycetes bacterium]